MEDMFFVECTFCIDEWLTSSHSVWYLRQMLQFLRSLSWTRAIISA
jgi:hypothetical protein